MSVRLIAVTPDAERLIAYCARVSSPQNQENAPGGLLAYCIKHKHWSVFEMANMVLEIVTSRAISAQILRHRSFSFQEFSQRYAAVTAFEMATGRRQADKNRQSSIADLPDETVQWFYGAQREITDRAAALYAEAALRGVAKESARFLLPMSAQTRLYMNGTVRSWIHYIDLRTQPDVQAEHWTLARQAKAIFCLEFPQISVALGWATAEVSITGGDK